MVHLYLKRTETIYCSRCVGDSLNMYYIGDVLEDRTLTFG